MKQPMVVGYKGEIGSFILNGLLRVMPKALDIWCVDINESDEEVESRIKVADTIFLCVPLQKTVDWLLKFKTLLKDKIIIEQCSLKEWIYNNKSLQGLNIKSMHILFRPSQTPDLLDRVVGLFTGQFDRGSLYRASRNIKHYSIKNCLV
jgi:prephenate dehydrogenase